jgi:peptidyl-prolyl cis-trans isomerase SurA
MCWKKFNHWAACVLCGAMWFAAPAGAATMDRIVAKVNKTIITQSELEERAFFKLISLQKMNVNPMPTKEKVMFEELQRMVENRLLIDAGKDLGLKVDKASVAQAIDEIKRNNNLNDEELERMLESEAKTMEEYKNNIRNQILISRVMGYEVRKRATVNNEEVDRYYRENQKEFWVDGKLKLRHILFLMDQNLLESERQLKGQMARQALQKIRAGGDFNTVAKEFSEDLTANTGGDLGEIERGKMVPEFEKAAFRLKEGEVSGLVETPYGLHIIKVDKIIPGRTLPLAEVKKQIENKLQEAKYQSEAKAYLQELRDKAFVQIKLAPPPEPVVKQAKKIEPKIAVEPSLLKQNEPAPKIPRRNPAQLSGTLPRNSEYSKFQAFEEQLKYFKQLRDNKKISEGEYQHKKKELLNLL